MIDRTVVLREALDSIKKVATAMELLLAEPAALSGDERLTVREVARLMKCSVTFVGDEIRTGALKATRIGQGARRFYRVKASDLAAYERARAQRGRA